VSGLEYFSVPLVAGLLCSLVGYLIIGSVRGRWGFGADAVIVFLAVIASAFVGFAAGFYGPIFLSSSASQGPLLGIFLTGPLGALLGLVVSLIYVLKMRKDPVRTYDS
jgi:hypothetical protein